MKYQSPKEIIDTTNWEYDFDNPVFPEGSRDKNLVISPGIAPYSFLKNNFAYLFKLSRQRYPSQFWIEIIAYRVGCLMGIEVPPAFVAYNKTKDQSASLIEWFYDQSSSAPVRESYIRGGQIMDRLYNDYDHEKGRKHNVYALMKYSNLLCKRGCDLAQ